MLGKDSVQNRLERGLSFTEFSYMLLQAADFEHLFRTAGVEMQMGGADQWGNITAGIDLVHKRCGAEVFGLTIPLVCDSAGQKFGKSEGNAVYLDHRKTSYYKFYQFFLRTADADASRYLKIFTFLSAEEILALEAEAAGAPEKRIPQLRLATEVTRMVHGEKGLRVAQQASQVLFGGDVRELGADDLLGVLADVPSTELSREAVAGRPAIDIAAQSGMCKSKGEARRLVTSGGFYVNNERVTDAEAIVRETDLVEGRVLVLRSGKRTYHVVKVV
jgi:tyrosyl-tRNA synthetase